MGENIDAQIVCKEFLDFTGYRMALKIIFMIRNRIIRNTKSKHSDYNNRLDNVKTKATQRRKI